MLDQRRRRLAGIVQMLYIFFVFAIGSACELPIQHHTLTKITDSMMVHIWVNIKPICHATLKPIRNQLLLSESLI